MREFKAYGALRPNGPLEPSSFKPRHLGPEEVEIKVFHCGLCHSDLSMLDNQWGTSQYKTVQAGYLTANRCKVMPTETNQSPEPALIMKAVIICDEFAFVASAASTLARVGRQAAVNVEWIARCWPTNAFKDVTFADNALNEAVDAHLILFSAQCALPAWVLDWLSRWAARRSVQTAALGVIRDWNAAAVTKPILQELWEFAHEFGLNFVVDERPAATNPSRVLVNFRIERELALPVAQVCSTDLDTQGSYRCFGINE